MQNQIFTRSSRTSPPKTAHAEHKNTSPSFTRPNQQTTTQPPNPNQTHKQTNHQPPPQAFHWFATSPTLHSLHRTLQTHGALGLIWNVETYNSPASSTPPTTWEKTLQAHTLTFEDSQQRFRNDKWRQVFLDQVSHSPLKLLVAGDGPLFSMPLGEETEVWTVWLTRDELWDRYRTLGQVAVLEGEALEVSFLLFLLSCLFLLVCFGVLIFGFLLLACRRLARSLTMLSVARMWRRMRRGRWLFMGLLMLSGRLRSRQRARMRCLRFRGRRLEEIQ